MKSTNYGTTKGVELDWQTIVRLEERGQMEGDETFEDVVSRLLNETCVSIPIEEFIERIREDTEAVQIAAQKTRTDPLDIVVNTETELSEDLLKGVHAVEVNGRVHQFRLDVDRYGPQTVGRVTFYAEEPLQDVHGDSVEGDIEKLEDWISNQLERDGGEERP